MRAVRMLAVLLFAVFLFSDAAAGRSSGDLPKRNGLISFTSYRDGNPEIYVMNADGSGQRRLTRDPATNDWSAWSPDGQRIVFVRGGGLTDLVAYLYVMNADGSGQHRLTRNPVKVNATPAWSPDRRKNRLREQSRRPDRDLRHERRRQRTRIPPGSRCLGDRGDQPEDGATGARRLVSMKSPIAASARLTEPIRAM